MNRLLLKVATVVGLALAPAHAQDAPPPEQRVVVTGERDRNRAAPVRSYIEAVSIETEDQIARFEAPICPASFGLPQGQNEVVAERIRLVAEHLGVRTADRDCRPNVVVIVADDGEQFLRALRRERPALFAHLPLADIRAMLRLEGPARAWHQIEARGADGRPMERINWLETGSPPPRYIVRGRRLPGIIASRISLPTRQDLSLAFIVFDLEALEGLTLLQIADHAAIRALARTRPATLPARRSILGLFVDRDSGVAPVEELTGWDVAYLQALYRSGNTIAANQQRGTMSRLMRAELEASDR
jgi:hypothetical protein